MISDEPIPTAAWRWLKLATAIVLTALAAAILAIGSGFFDPRPVGILQHSYRLKTLEAGRQTERVHWLEEPHLASSYSLRLMASLSGGELDSGYGLALGRPDDYLIIAVAPTGYVTIQPEGDSREFHLPWQTWPHVRQGQGQNEIWLDVHQNQLVSVRINRELFWEGRLPLDDPDLGLWLRSYGEPAQIAFFSLAYFAETQQVE